MFRRRPSPFDWWEVGTGAPPPRFVPENVAPPPPPPRRRTPRRLRNLPVPPTEPEQRAMWLLMRYLTEEQRQEFALHQYFHVTGSDGRTYRINYGTIANVDALSPSEQIVEGRLCCIIAESVPTGDHMLAQLLALQTDAKSFREIARWYPPEREFTAIGGSGV